MSTTTPSLMKYMKPFMCIIHNIPSLIGNGGRKVMTCNTNSLLQIIHNAGLNTIMSIDHAYDRNQGFLGYAIIQFGLLNERESFLHGRKLEKHLLMLTIQKCGSTLIHLDKALTYGWQTNMIVDKTIVR